MQGWRINICLTSHQQICSSSVCNDAIPSPFFSYLTGKHMLKVLKMFFGISTSVFPYFIFIDSYLAMVYRSKESLLLLAQSNRLNIQNKKKKSTNTIVFVCLSVTIFVMFLCVIYRFKRQLWVFYSVLLELINIGRITKRQ